eukprot:Gb_41428 [translate_table: standard]
MPKTCRRVHMASHHGNWENTLACPPCQHNGYTNTSLGPMLAAISSPLWHNDLQTIHAHGERGHHTMWERKEIRQPVLHKGWKASVSPFIHLIVLKPLTHPKNEIRVSAAVKDKFSAATEQAKEFSENLKCEADGSSEKTTTNAADPSNGFKYEKRSATGAEKTEGTGSASSQEAAGTNETLFSKFGKGISFASSSAASALKSLKDAKILDVTRKGYIFVKEELSSTPSRRQRLQNAAAAAASTTMEKSSATDIVPAAAKQTRWGKKWEEFKEKARGHPLFKHVRGITEHPAVAKGQELAEDIREQWETSDSPVVHKIQDLNETIFGETAAAISYKEIRRRDPSFSLPDFIADVQEIIKPTLQAYLKACYELNSQGDLETLKKNCSFEVIDRCKAERRAYESQGIFFDNKVSVTALLLKL